MNISLILSPPSLIQTYVHKSVARIPFTAQSYLCCMSGMLMRIYSKLKPALQKARTFLRTRRGRHALVLCIICTVYAFCLPRNLFEDPASTVVLSADGQLLGARIAADGQWRFPARNKAPEKFSQCLIQFEDRNFRQHPGVNPLALARALRQNLSGKRVVSGGSTITMQVIRMARRNPPRNLWQKGIEIVLASRLELRYSKDEILALYASHAPFGSNVVGIDAAAWRYFGRTPEQLSWAESATLAVLPNSPSLIYPGKNQQRLKNKRDRLLEQLCTAGIIDRSTCDLAKHEPLPGAPYLLPRLAPHLLQRAAAEGRNGQIIHSTLNYNLQDRVNGIVASHARTLRTNEIHNCAALVLDVETGNVLAYAGNAPAPLTTELSGDEYGNDVDVITAPRSTGSILKPYLYAAMLTDGELLPNTLVPDIPTDLSGYSPENFNRTYDGAVPAHRALARSLNVPAVRMLKQYRVERFHTLLRRAGLSTITRTPDDYGLSLILGGAEGKLWDLAGTYASMARNLNHYTRTGKNLRADFHAANYMHNQIAEDTTLRAAGARAPFDPAAIWFTFEAMSELTRPDDEAAWAQFSSSKRVAWKTGTSFGFRDGWAIGVTPRYVVAVWAGNADGEGRPGLTGIATAAPIMFDIFAMLPTGEWFTAPLNDMQEIEVCTESGHRALDICPKQKMRVPKAGLKSSPCPYHRTVHLNLSGEYRVTSDCESPGNMQHVPWFVLPPSMEFYYKTKNPGYRALPPLRTDCISGSGNTKAMEFVYPRDEPRLFIPTELNGRPGKVVFEIAHRRPGTKVFWHLDEEYLGETKDIHQFASAPAEGVHTLTVVDEQGETISMQVEIVSKKN
jgi:penicillin-binding protein 1C